MQTPAELVEHYRHNPEEAWKDGFTSKICSEWIDAEVYDIYQYYMPCKAAKKIRFVKQYFQKLTKQETLWKYRRRNCWQEFAETAIMILARIDVLIRKDSGIIAGSKMVNAAIPWATFGNYRNSEIFAQNSFENIPEIFKHYNIYLKGACYPVTFHFRNMENLPQRLGQKFKKTPNFIMAAAIVLLADIIQECGPDCHEFFELYTNDTRESPANIDLDDWFDSRCNMLGVVKKICPLRELTVNKKTFVRHHTDDLWEYETKKEKPFRFKANMKEIFCGTELLGTEPVRRTFLSKLQVPQAPMNDDGYDDADSNTFHHDIDVMGPFKRPLHKFGYGTCDMI